MRRIFTSMFLSAALVAASFNSFGQTCTFNTTAPGGAPGATNTFTTDAEGFTGDFTYVGGSTDLLRTNTGAGVRVITSPIYYRQPGLNPILVRFSLDMVSNNDDITNLVVKAVTNTTTYTLCTFSSLAVTPNTATPYYLTLPIGSLPASVNFRLVLEFTQVGEFDFDDFGTNLANANGSLPVKFSSFEGKSVNGGVNLTWNVASEENVGRYEVEKSADNRNFTTIGSVEADGKDAYSFLDTKATTATSYYRVKGVDLDGKMTFSAIVTMKGGKSSIMLKGFPMPVISDFTLQHSTATAGSEISISSAEGREVKTLVPAKGSQQTVISLASLNPGVYVIRYSNINGEVETLKIVKQ